MFQAINIARFLVQVAVFVFLNARFFGVAPSDAFVPYLQASGSPFTVVHGAYESLEIAITHTVFPFIAVAFVFFFFFPLSSLRCDFVSFTFIVFLSFFCQCADFDVLIAIINSNIC